MRLRAVFASLVLALPLLAVQPAANAAPGRMPVEVFSPDGSISRAETSPVVKTRSAATAPATLNPVEVNGPSDHRIDLVFLGDGYTEAEQGLLADQTKAAWELLAAREPFKSYRKLFNVWRIDIVSPVSGVSGDPTADIVKDTPLGSTYWCEGLERLVCADIPTAKQYAALAPDMDQVGVVVNSTKYGGAGYMEEDLITFAGGNELGPEILPHELGHSVAELADEYPYWAYPGDGSTWPGDEPAEVNVSTKPAEQMESERAKWWYWLGEPTPDGGVLGTFEGANYYEKGIFRPSDNSLMRSLQREFNLVGREEMLRSFYQATGLIDSHTPNKAPVSRKSELSVSPVPIDGLSVRWYVNGREHRPWRNRTTVKVHGRGRGGTVTAVVSDPTPWVRNGAYRAEDLTERVTWRVRRAGH